LSSFGQGKSYIELKILSVFIIFLLISFYEPDSAEFIRNGSKKVWDSYVIRAFMSLSFSCGFGIFWNTTGMNTEKLASQSFF